MKIHTNSVNRKIRSRSCLFESIPAFQGKIWGSNSRGSRISFDGRRVLNTVKSGGSISTQTIAFDATQSYIVLQKLPLNKLILVKIYSTIYNNPYRMFNICRNNSLSMIIILESSCRKIIEYLSTQEMKLHYSSFIQMRRIRYWYFKATKYRQ